MAVVMLMPVVSSVITCLRADDAHHAWKMMAVSCCPRGDQRCDALITTHRTRLHIAEQLSHDRSFSLGLRLTEALVYVRHVHHERSQRIGTALMMAGIEGGIGEVDASLVHLVPPCTTKHSAPARSPPLRPTTCVVVTRESRVRFAERARTNEQVNYSA